MDSAFKKRAWIKRRMEKGSFKRRRHMLKRGPMERTALDEYLLTSRQQNHRALCGVLCRTRSLHDRMDNEELLAPGTPGTSYLRQEE